MKGKWKLYQIQLQDARGIAKPRARGNKTQEESQGSEPKTNRSQGTEAKHARLKLGGGARDTRCGARGKWSEKHFVWVPLSWVLMIAGWSGHTLPTFCQNKTPKSRWHKTTGYIISQWSRQIAWGPGGKVLWGPWRRTCSMSLAQLPVIAGTSSCSLARSQTFRPLPPSSLAF